MRNTTRNCRGWKGEDATRAGNVADAQHAPPLTFMRLPTSATSSKRLR